MYILNNQLGTNHVKIHLSIDVFIFVPFLLDHIYMNWKLLYVLRHRKWRLYVIVCIEQSIGHRAVGTWCQGLLEIPGIS